MGEGSPLPGQAGGPARAGGPPERWLAGRAAASQGTLAFLAYAIGSELTLGLLTMTLPSMALLTTLSRPAAEVWSSSLATTTPRRSTIETIFCSAPRSLSRTACVWVCVWVVRVRVRDFDRDFDRDRDRARARDRDRDRGRVRVRCALCVWVCVCAWVWVWVWVCVIVCACVARGLHAASE